MFVSRKHLTNGIISLALDALNGEPLELIREATGDNVLKNYPIACRQLLDGMLLTPEGNKRFTVPRYLEIIADPSLTPKLQIDQGDEEASAIIFYPSLISDGKPVDLSAEITIRLPRGDCRSFWQLKLDNQTGFEVDDVAFPSLDGIWLGESWKDDTLVYPHFAGCRIDNPTEQLPSEPRIIHWKWQEYVFTYNVGQATGTRDERGAYVRRLNYSGEASMMWMDLYQEKEGAGLYLACRNQNLTMKSLRMQAFGLSSPGTGLAIIHRPALQAGSWTSDECVLALHEGDWHWGADDYRTWFSTLDRPLPRVPRPEWFEKSPGLMAHYDFQYQGGGIVHTFADIPGLLLQARKMGFNHLLLSGWNEDGFDYGFPHYHPNPRLGGADALRDAVRQVKEMGGHVSFYINSRLCNTIFEDQQERIRQSAIMQKDGSLYIEKYGADNISFASLCINDTEWRHFLADTVKYMTHDIGADSMYLDQFAMATSLKCYHPDHHEHENDPCAWNQGYEKLLDEMEQDYEANGMALLYEGCNDIFGPRAAGQLISELHCPFLGRMPQVYKYTFPDQILMDMMNPRRHSAMRPEHVARHSTELLHNAFTTGAYFWCYDLEMDNTWRRDPEQYQRLCQLTALRSAWLSQYGQGRFTDTVGLQEIPEAASVRRFELDDGILLACAAEAGLKGTVLVRWNGSALSRAEMMLLSDPAVRPGIVTASEKPGWVRVTLPPEDTAVIVLKA